MKNLKNGIASRLSKAFTLVELLIVIGILGVLVVALFIALDPVEQTNRAVDSSRRILATDIVNTFSRFYAVKQYSPACIDSGCATFLDGLIVADTATTLASSLTNVNTALNTSGETKTTTSFTAHQEAGNLSASLNNSGSTNLTATAVVCWRPVSKTQKAISSITNPNATTFNIYGVVQTLILCPADSTNTCYQCIKQ